MLKFYRIRRYLLINLSKKAWTLFLAIIKISKNINSCHRGFSNKIKITYLLQSQQLMKQISYLSLRIRVRASKLGQLSRFMKNWPQSLMIAPTQITPLMWNFPAENSRKQMLLIWLEDVRDCQPYLVIN